VARFLVGQTDALVGNREHNLAVLTRPAIAMPEPVGEYFTAFSMS
jgi:hypothetical protein